MKTNLRLVVGLIAVSFAQGHLRAQSCFTLLAPVFSNAKAPGDVSGQTFATVTKHYAGGNTSGNPDPVRYAFGPLIYKLLWWSNSGWTDTVYGTIDYRQNTSKTATMDMFAAKDLTLSLSINAYGVVSVQERINGNPIGGMPATVYQGTCSTNGSAGLITVTDHGTTWSFSLTTLPPTWIK